MRTSWAKELLAHSKAIIETENNLIVIPANAGIHLDLAVAVVALNLAPKVKMDPSVRWDDGEESIRGDDDWSIVDVLISHLPSPRSVPA